MRSPASGPAWSRVRVDGWRADAVDHGHAFGSGRTRVWSRTSATRSAGWRRQPVFVAIAVLSLAAGIGLNTAVFSIVNAIFLQSIRGVPQPDRVAAIGTRVTFATFRDLRDSVRTLDGGRGVAAGRRPAALPRRACSARACPRSPTTYFAVLGVEPLARPVLRRRRTSACRSRPPKSSLDFEFWRDALGSDPQAVGQTIADQRHARDHSRHRATARFTASGRNGRRCGCRSGCCRRCAARRRDGTTPASPAGACSAGSPTAVSIETGERRAAALSAARRSGSVSGGCAARRDRRRAVRRRRLGRETHRVPARRRAAAGGGRR